LEGDGYVVFTATETGAYRMIGLGSGDASASYTDIEHAWYLYGGSLQIYEAGSSAGSFGSYAAGDTFRVEARGGVVRYFHDDVLVYTSTRAPAFPLRVDTSFYTSGGAIGGVDLVDCGSGEPDAFCDRAVTWRNGSYIRANVEDLATTQPSAGWYAGVSSVETLLCSNGEARAIATETTTDR